MVIDWSRTGLPVLVCTGLYWSVDPGLLSTATLPCFKVFCNEGIVWLYIIILTIIIIIIVVLVHDYYLSSLFA